MMNMSHGSGGQERASSKVSKVRIMKSLRKGHRNLNSIDANANTPMSRTNLMQSIANMNDFNSRTHTETELPESPDTKKGGFSAFAGQSPSRAQLDSKAPDIFTYLKELDDEIQTSSNEPHTFEEAKALIHVKNGIINKLRSQISNYLTTTTTTLGRDTEADNSLIQFLKNENSRLESKLLLLHSEFNLEKAKADQIKEAYNEQKHQLYKLSHLNTELEIAGRNALKKENESWQKIFDEIKYTHQKEMQRKQEEVTKVHDLLAAWVFRYMEMQEIHNIVPTLHEKMLYEAYKRKEVPQKALLEKVLIATKTSAQQLTNSIDAGTYRTVNTSVITEGGRLYTPQKARVSLPRYGSPTFQRFSASGSKLKKSFV